MIKVKILNPHKGRNEPTIYASTEEFTGAGAAVTRTFTDS